MGVRPWSVPKVLGDSKRRLVLRRGGVYALAAFDLPDSHHAGIGRNAGLP